MRWLPSLEATGFPAMHQCWQGSIIVSFCCCLCGWETEQIQSTSARWQRLCTALQNHLFSSIDEQLSSQFSNGLFFFIQDICKDHKLLLWHHKKSWYGDMQWWLWTFIRTQHCNCLSWCVAHFYQSWYSNLSMKDLWWNPFWILHLS